MLPGNLWNSCKYSCGYPFGLLDMNRFTKKKILVLLRENCLNIYSDKFGRYAVRQLIN